MRKKILFWITTDLIQFYIAYYLQKKDEFDFYAIIDTPYYPKQFFEQQNLVKFKKIWYLYDFVNKQKTKPNISYLKIFEKKYDVPLWKLIINERIFYRFYHFHDYDYDQVLSIDEQICHFYENVLDEVKPIAFITKEPGFHHLELLNQMCKTQNIKVMMPFVPKLANKIIISDDPLKIDSDIIYDDIESSNRTFEQLKEIFQAKNTSGVVKNFLGNFASSKFELLKASFRYLFLSNNKSEEVLYTYYGRTKLNVLFSMIISTLKRKYRKSFIDKNLEKNPTLNSPFVYFAMGVDLERNILLDAPFFTNQIEVIRHVAKSLPVEYKLYVKETSGQSSRDWRSILEYNQLLKIPNVCLIHPEYSSKNLLEHSSIVVTIAGSSGFEAAFYEKPSIVFSNTLYTKLPSVFQVKSPEELPQIVKKALTTTVKSNDLDKYMTFLEKNSIDFPWHEFEVKRMNTFSYGGQYLDAPISEEKVKSFLDENEIMMKDIAQTHLEKLDKLNLQKENT